MKREANIYYQLERKETAAVSLIMLVLTLGSAGICICREGPSVFLQSPF